jgi:hypothetical protein
VLPQLAKQGQPFWHVSRKGYMIPAAFSSIARQSWLGLCKRWVCLLRFTASVQCAIRPLLTSCRLNCCEPSGNTIKSRWCRYERSTGLTICIIRNVAQCQGFLLKYNMNVWKKWKID